jgi:uncharacterized protein YijF (DUF1287 family)
MPLLRKLSRRLRFAALRAYSKDHRDFQTVGSLAAWQARRSRASSRPAALDDRPRYSHLPALSGIVAARREGAILHVELVARSKTLDERPLILAQDGSGAACDGAAPECRSDPRADARTWTITLVLN